ncbi:MAG: AraC family transcriptional regulator [Parvularculaceae bacterium]
MRLWLPESRATFRWGDFFDCAPDWSWSVRDLPYLDLWYVAAGVGWIGDGDRRWPLTADDCLVLRRGGAYAAGHEPERPLKLIAVHFELWKPEGGVFDPPSEHLPPFSRKMEAGGFFRELLDRAINCHRDGCFDWACAWLQAALMEVVRQDARTWPAGPLGDQARRIEQMCKRIQCNPGRHVRVESLAAELNISAKHFCRLFRYFQGVSPRAYITRTRLETARTLLLRSNHSIAQIAEMLGYDTPFHFSRQFKTHIGLSPSKFRRDEERKGSLRQQQKKTR